MHDATTTQPRAADNALQPRAKGLRMGNGKATGGNLPARAGGAAGTADARNACIVGIDPGASTGVAYFTGGQLRKLETIAPHQIPAAIKCASRVIFEDSRLISHMFTTVKSRPAALKMARNVGEIDAWCRLIVATCADLGIDAHGISPKQKGAKLDAAQFAAKTGWCGKSNAHERDAAMCAWPYRGAK